MVSAFARWRRRSIASGLAGILIVACLAAPGPAAADFNSSDYSHANSGCSDRVDPISLVLYGYSAYESHARYVLAQRMSWYNSTGGGQYAWSHGCSAMDGQVYDGTTAEERNHARLNQTAHLDLKGRWETVGTPHYDEFAICGGVVRHVASTFVYTRNLIAGQMSYYYGVSYQNWGNTQAQRQCDGRYVASDGQVAWINIG